MAKDENKVAQPLEEKPKQKDEGSGEGGSVLGRDVLDPTANKHVYPADIGYSVTSYGDGSPTIAPQLVKRREEIKSFNADPDRDNKAIAKELGLKVDE